MRKLNSIICVVLCLMLIVSLFTGCAGSSKQSASDQTPSEQTSGKTSEQTSTKSTEPATTSDEPLVISWLCTNGSTLVYDFENMAWCQEILRRANVKLEMELIDSSVYRDTVMPRLAAGVDLPDVIQLPSLDSDMAYINSGVFIDLTDLYDKYGVNLNKRFEDNPTVRGQISTPDGRIYYVPVINMSIDYCTAINMNLPWLEALGLSIPETTDQYYETLKAMKGKDLNGNGQDDEIPLFMRSGMLQLFGAMWGLDLNLGYTVEEDGTVKCSYTSERYKNFLEYWHKMYKEGLLYNEFATATYDIQNNLFSQNRIGSILHYHNNDVSYSQLIDPNYDLEKDKLIMSPIEPLKGPYGHKFYWGNDPIAGFFGITRFCEKPEEVFKFIDYLYSEEANYLLYFGIEGVDYVREGDKIILDTKKRNTDNYANRMGHNFGGFPRILLGIHRDFSYNAEVAENNKRLKPYYVLPIGNSFFLEEELDIVQAYSTDLSTYWSEMFIAFITGTRDLSEFDNYVDTLKTMHVEDMEKVYQAKYNRQLQAQ